MIQSQACCREDNHDAPWRGRVFGSMTVLALAAMLLAVPIAACFLAVTLGVLLISAFQNLNRPSRYDTARTPASLGRRPQLSEERHASAEPTELQTLSAQLATTRAPSSSPSENQAGSA